MQLSQGEHRILMYISNQKRCPSQKSLAQAHCITSAAVTQILSSLEEKGLIKRHASKDTRYNEIIITENGKRIVEETHQRFLDIDKKTFHGFSKEELNSYYGFLIKLEENLKTILGGNE